MQFFTWYLLVTGVHSLYITISSIFFIYHYKQYILTQTVMNIDMALTADIVPVESGSSGQLSTVSEVCTSPG